MVKVKICGLTNSQDAVTALKSGADLLGFIFIEGTPRAVSKEKVKEIIDSLPEDLRESSSMVGLFKDEKIDKVIEAADFCGLDCIQLHGEESPDYCRSVRKETHCRILKVFKVSGGIIPNGPYVTGDYTEADYFVFDTFHPDLAGGTGVSFDCGAFLAAEEEIHKPFFIAGGLNPLNVAEAVRTLKPYGVDASSGVEEETAKKDEKLLKEFIKNAKEI